MSGLAAGDTSIDVPGRDRGDEIGQMAEALGVFRDAAIEVQRSNQREICEGRRRLAVAIENISEAFSLYDGEDRLVVCNNKYRTLLYPGDAADISLGMTFESIVRRAAERGYVKDAEGRVDEWVRERVARHREPSGSHVQQRGDGRWILVSEHKTGDGSTVAVYSDITELKQRENQLSHTISELRALDEVSQAVNSTLDLETVLTTIVAKAVQLSDTEAGAIYVFDDVQREFHLRATYGMDQALIDALAHQHIGLDDPNIKPALAHPEPIQIADLREGAPSGVNEIILRAGFRALLVAPLLRGESIVGVLVVRRRTPGVFPQNIVDLIKTFAAQSAVAIFNARLFREIEDKGRQLEVAGQHKSQFLANMSHELRTPLNAIIGYSEILQEDAADLGHEGFVRDLKKIESSGRHLLGLINDILDLSKVEAGRMDIFLEDVEIVPLLEEVRAIIVPLAETKGNVLEFGPAENLGSIRTDRTKLKQSLLNILSNGSKFTENGRLTLVAERFETDRPMVRFAISDTGIGMTEEQLGRLFQAFSQADASTSKKYGGTGLGLAISQRFCQLLGGDISVTSQPGEGSTFTITLPDQTETLAQVKPADAPHISGDANSATTVLLVDDDPTARDLLTASLKGAGYRLVHATNGTEALNLAR